MCSRARRSRSPPWPTPWAPSALRSIPFGASSRPMSWRPNALAAEIIVVDDGSSDHPEDVVAQFPEVRFIRQDNKGLAAARNTGLRAACSDKVVFLDAD